MDILISAADLEKAPRPVRDWLVNLLARQLTVPPAPDAAASGALDLAEISPRDAAILFDRLRTDYFACQVLLEFGRDNPVQQPEPPGIHRLAVADVLHHLRLGSPDQLIAALNRIATLWGEIAPSAAAALFALDEAGNLYVSRATQASLRALWHQLVTERYADLVDANPSGPSVPIDGGLQPARAG